MDDGGVGARKAAAWTTQDVGWMAPPDLRRMDANTRQLTAAAMAPRVDNNDYLGANPGGTLGTAQANPCCWLTPIGS